MTELLPQAYLLGLIVLLSVVALVLSRQILRVRRDELTLSRLGEGSAAAPDSAALYELASVQLRKRLYGQACDNLRKGLKRAEAEQAPPEAVALLENALGFGLAAQERYGPATRHYRAALRARPAYPVALNNLAFALEKQDRPDEARTTYEQVLSLEPSNATARRRLRSLDRRSGRPDGKDGEAA